MSVLFSSEEQFLEYWTDAQYAGYEAAEAYDNESGNDGYAYVHDDVSFRHIEELAYLRQVRYEEEVDEVDVESAHSDVLQEASYAGVLGE